MIITKPFFCAVTWGHVSVRIVRVCVRVLDHYREGIVWRSLSLNQFSGLQALDGYDLNAPTTLQLNKSTSVLLLQVYAGVSSEYQNSVVSLVSERTVTASSQVFSVEYQFKGISAPSSQY